MLHRNKTRRKVGNVVEGGKKLLVKHGSRKPVAPESVAPKPVAKVETAKVETAKVEAAVTPAKPAIQPAKPVVEAAKPAIAKAIEAKPAVAAAKPAAPVAKSVVAAKPAEIAAKAAKPVAKAIEAAPKPAEVVAKTAEIVAKPVEMTIAAVEAVQHRAVAVAEKAIETVPTPSDTIEKIEAALSPAITRDTLTDATIAPILEGLEAMANTSPTQTVGIASEKLQSMFGDVGARFKASFEKSSKLGEEMVELSKGNVEAVVASARVAAKGSEALGQDVAEYGKKSLETAVAAMKSFASVKSPTELFQLQSDYAKTSFDSMIAEASKFSESMMKLAGDVAQPLSTRYALAAEKIKAVAL